MPSSFLEKAPRRCRRRSSSPSLFASLKHTGWVNKTHLRYFQHATSYMWLPVCHFLCSAGWGRERAAAASGADVVGKTGAGGAAAGRGRDEGETLTSDLVSSSRQSVIGLNYPSPPLLQSPSHRGKRQPKELMTELRRRQGKDSRHVYEGKDGAIEDIITGKHSDQVNTLQTYRSPSVSWLAVCLLTCSSEDRPLYGSIGQAQLSLLLWPRPLWGALLRERTRDVFGWPHPLLIDGNISTLNISNWLMWINNLMVSLSHTLDPDNPWPPEHYKKWFISVN